MKKNASFLTTLLIGVATIGLSQTKAATEAKIDSLLPSNQTKQITASRLREAIKSVVEYATPSNLPSGSIALNKLNGEGASEGQVATWNGTAWVPTYVIQPAVTSNVVNLVVITGESNSGGYALNSQAPSNEVGIRNEAKILNNTSFQFESLNIGANNLIDHAGLSCCSTHGLELGLANKAKDSTITQLYIVKTGQGASRIGDWGTNGTYWNKFNQRVDSAIAILKRQNKIPVLYVLYSQGINDALASYSPTVWRDSTLSHFAKIRSKYGFVPIIMTKLMSNYSTYNAQIDVITASNPYNYSVEVSGLGLRDTNHWDYLGMKEIAYRMISVMKNQIGYFPQYAFTQNGAMWKYITKTGTIGSNITNDNGSGGGATNTAGVPTWTALANAIQSGDYLQMSGSTPAGGRATATINAQQAFSIVIDVPTTLSESNGVVVYLDENQADTFAWETSKTFIAGAYTYDGGLFTPVGGYAATANGTVAAGNKIRLRKSGNDIVYEKSVDNGVNYTTVTTATGVLSGKSTLYLKGLFAIAGSYKIKVQVSN